MLWLFRWWWCSLTGALWAPKINDVVDYDDNGDDDNDNDDDDDD